MVFSASMPSMTSRSNAGQAVSTIGRRTGILDAPARDLRGIGDVSRSDRRVRSYFIHRRTTNACELTDWGLPRNVMQMVVGEAMRSWRRVFSSGSEARLH